MAGFLDAIPGLSTLLNYFQNERHQRSQDEENALIALHQAVHETNKYIAEKGIPNPEKEMELSDLWGKAAIAVRRISKDLAKRCYIKRGYWKDTDSWTYDNIVKENILLSDIEDELGKLIEK